MPVRGRKRLLAAPSAVACALLALAGCGDEVKRDIPPELGSELISTVEQAQTAGCEERPELIGEIEAQAEQVSAQVSSETASDLERIVDNLRPLSESDCEQEEPEEEETTTSTSTTEETTTEDTTTEDTTTEDTTTEETTTDETTTEETTTGPEPDPDPDPDPGGDDGGIPVPERGER